MRAIFPIFRPLIAAVAALALALGLTPVVTATPVEAQTIRGEGPGGSLNLTQGEPRGREAEDWATVQAAQSALTAGGYSALQAHLPRLKAVLGRFPGIYPAQETRGRRVIIRADDEQEAMTQGLIIGTMAMTSGRGAVTVESRPNVYPRAALLLASEAVEGGRFDEAIGYLDLGLARQPRNIGLAAEKAAALNFTDRHAEVLTLLDPLVETTLLDIGGSTAVLQRHRGFALIELGRLDEAEAAYRASLEDEPENATARSQLAYIGHLRTEGDKWGSRLVRPPAAGPEANPEKSD